MHPERVRGKQHQGIDRITSFGGKSHGDVAHVNTLSVSVRCGVGVTRCCASVKACLDFLSSSRTFIHDPDPACHKVLMI